MGIFKTFPSSKMRKGAEQGWSLVNTLVTVVLTLIVGSVAIALIVSAQRGSSQFTDTVMTESELNNAMSTMTRSITTAEHVAVADDNLLKITTVDNNVRSDITYFAYSPDNYNEVKPYLTGDYASGENIAKGDLPAFPAVVSVTTTFNQDGEATGDDIRVLVNGYIQEDNKLFSYYDGNNEEMATVLLGDETTDITRVQIHLKATVEGREAPMELATSVVPRMAGEADVEKLRNTDPPQAVMLQGVLPPRTKQAELSWNAVDNADAYVLYRENNDQETNPRLITTTSGTDWTDEEIQWGETYNYYVIATNYAGAGPKSNVVSLTATPPAPHLKGEVTESFDNYIEWEPSNGAVGYRILKDGKAWKTVNGLNNTDITDTDVTPGDYNTYKAVAFNGNGTGSGETLGNGDSHWSNELTLHVKPAAPVLRGYVDKGDRILNWMSTPESDGYQLRRISPQGKNFPLQDGLAYTDDDRIQSDSFKYQVRSKNNDGWSRWSNIVDLNPIPAPVQPNVKDYTDSSSSYSGKNLATWKHAPSNQATNYDFKKGSGSWNNVGMTTSEYDTKPGTDSKNTYHLRACNYTGCSDSRNDQGLQPPGIFSAKLNSELARTGFHSTRSDTNDSLRPQSANFGWTTSSGADSYYYTGTGKNATTTGKSFTTKNYTPGNRYTLKVTANGKTSGLSRQATQNWQAAPAQPNNIRYRMQYKGKSDGDTRFRFWASKYGPTTGSADRVELRHGVVTRTTSGKWLFSKDSSNGFDTWTGAKTTSAFNKSGTHANYHKGGMSYARSYKSKPSGYAGESYSRSTNGTGYYDVHDGSSWSTLGDNSKMHRGYIGLYAGTSVANPNNWQQSNGAPAPTRSSWGDVAYTPANYPMNWQTGYERNWYEVIAR